LSVVVDRYQVGKRSAYINSDSHEAFTINRSLSALLGVTIKRFLPEFTLSFSKGSK
jgi:hypothetical protein